MAVHRVFWHPGTTAKLYLLPREHAKLQHILKEDGWQEMAWNHGSMGWQRGWHYGQAHDMIREMREHAQSWPGWGDDGSNPISAFLESFAAKMGEKAADAVTGGDSDK